MSSAAVSVVFIVAVATLGASVHLRFWLQTITGNWNAPENFTTTYPIEFAVTAFLAVLINWLPLIGAFALIYGSLKRLLSDELVRERVRTMRLMDAFFLKDRVVKEQLYNSMSDAGQERLRPVVEKAFASGTEDWLDNWLPELYGGKETEDLKARLEADSPGLLDRMRGRMPTAGD